MFWSYGPLAMIVPFIMIFITIRLIRSLTGYRRDRYPKRLDTQDRGYDSIAVDVKRLNSNRSDGKSEKRFSTDSLEAKIFRLAYKQRGVVTVSDVVIDTGLSIADTEKILEGMVDGTHVKMELTQNGTVRYEFPEIIEGLEDNGV